MGKPVRIMMERNEDMVYSGHRHPFLGRYKVGFTAEGRLTGLKVDVYSNCGHSADLSIPVRHHALWCLSSLSLGLRESCDSHY